MGPYGTPTLAYDALRTTTPVCRVWVPSGLQVWLATRYEDVFTVHTNPTFSREEAVRTHAALVHDPSMELAVGVLQNSEDEKHARLRNVFACHYGQDHVSRWTDIISREAHKGIDGLRANEVLDLRADFFEPVARRSAEKIFGFPHGQHPPLELFFDPTIMSELRDHIVSMLRDRAESAKGSYLEVLSTATRNALISESDLVSNLIVFATVTFGAVRAPFLGGMFALLRDPVGWDACLQDRSLLRNAVDEMLRCYPNGDGQFLRVAMDDVVLSGVQIARGEVLLAPVSAANVDPSVFLEPRRFDVRRPNTNRHLAFGAGRHRCMGALLVKVWMHTALTALLDRLPSLRLAAPPKTITFRATPLINIMERLPVHIE
jgi:cytochrome P450